MHQSPCCALWMVAGWLVAGCVDPGAKLDAFHARKLASQAQDSGAPDAGPEGDGGPKGTLPSPAQLEGRYLFVVSTVLSPKKPILSVLEVKAVQKGARIELMQRDRQVSAKDRQTFVGPFGPWRSAVVQADGSYSTGSFDILTLGEANAVQPGVESSSTLEFTGKLPLTPAGEPEEPLAFWCGKANGVLTQPLMLSLDGSTYTVMRIVDPAAFPSPVINCAQEPAEPL